MKIPEIISEMMSDFVPSFLKSKAERYKTTCSAYQTIHDNCKPYYVNLFNMKKEGNGWEFINTKSLAKLKEQKGFDEFEGHKFTSQRIDILAEKLQELKKEYTGERTKPAQWYFLAASWQAVTEYMQTTCAEIKESLKITDAEDTGLKQELRLLKQDRGIEQLKSEIDVVRPDGEAYQEKTNSIHTKILNNTNCQAVQLNERSAGFKKDVDQVHAQTKVCLEKILQYSLGTADNMEKIQQAYADYKSTRQELSEAADRIKEQLKADETVIEKVDPAKTQEITLVSEVEIRGQRGTLSIPCKIIPAEIVVEESQKMAQDVLDFYGKCNV